MNFSQEVVILHQEIANGTPLVPPPNNDPDDLSRHFKKRRILPITGYGLLKFFIRHQTNARNAQVIGRVAGELWRAMAQQDKAAYKDLCDRINLTLRIKRYL
jgi:hypothetical protein